MGVSGAEAQKSFLDLPASLGVKVEDVIVLSLEGAEHEQITAAKTGAGILLVAKVCHALLNWGGYSDEDVRNVASLVARNLITCEESSPVQIEPKINVEEHGSTGGKGTADPRKTVESMLRGLLDPNIRLSRRVHINSNEPILLVNFDQFLHPENRAWVNDVIDTTVLQLQQQWNIWPVRVYAHADTLKPRIVAETGTAAHYDDTRGDGISITLLNVVNTDIGGPSMPQLFDASCDAPEWKGYVRREVWRGRECVIREDGEGDWNQQEDAAVEDDDASERSFDSENHDDDSKSVGSDVLNLATLKSPRRCESPERQDEPAVEHGGVTPETTTHGETPSSAHHEEDWVESDINADKDEDRDRATTQKPLSRELAMPERQVQHPTWERHHDSTSLIDLIRSQASMIAPFGTEDPGHGIGDIEGDVVQSRSEKVESSSPSDDEFIVV